MSFKSNLTSSYVTELYVVPLMLFDAVATLQEKCVIIIMIT